MAEDARFLVIGANGLREEFRSMLAGLTQPPQTSYASDLQRAVEEARAKRPELVFVEVGRDVRPLRALANELRTAAPEAKLIGILERDESALSGSAPGVLLDAVRSHVRDFLFQPLSSTDLRALMERWILPTGSGTAAAGAVVSVISNKGGVGKSTLAVNAAARLAEDGYRVLLIDLSLQLGICASMLDLIPETDVLDAVREQDRLDETMLVQLCAEHETGLRLLAAPRDPEQAGELTEEDVIRIVGLGRRAFDFVIIDTFPILDGIVAEVVDVSDLVLVVSNAMVPTVQGAAMLLETLDHLRVPRNKQRVVLNFNHQGFAGALNADDVAQRIGRPIQHSFGYSRRVMVGMNVGRPHGLAVRRFFGFPKSLTRLTEDIVELLADVQRGATQ